MRIFLKDTKTIRFVPCCHKMRESLEEGFIKLEEYELCPFCWAILKEQFVEVND